MSQEMEKQPWEGENIISLNHISQSLLEDESFLRGLRQKMMTKTAVWGDTSRLHIHPTAGMVNTFFNTSSGTITVGAYTFTGHNVSILTGTHYIARTEMARMDYPREGRDIVIGSGVWLASNVTVLGPCTIGDNAVVSAGSVVVPGTVIEPNTVWGGNPAKFIKTIFFEERKQVISDEPATECKEDLSRQTEAVTSGRTMLTVDHVSISYKIGDFKDIGLKEWIMRHLKDNYHVETFMAVNDVSFELQEGDMLGIIGANGAGKSTLLKAITGVMEPKSGHITRNGKVVALLELASGFDGDLTVKENAYLRGAMLGYTRDFMDGTYQQILDFSELWEFENRPFKQLSTGMQSRLAFSIASLVQPEILILDEVLSVGDGAFQEKSAKKMREIINGGTATILVSHSLGQIRNLCNKVLWLDHGRQVACGETEELCDKYEAFLNGNFII